MIRISVSKDKRVQEVLVMDKSVFDFKALRSRVIEQVIEDSRSCIKKHRLKGCCNWFI